MEFGIFDRMVGLITTIMENPKHIAIIMDGNRRWAKREGLSALKGHEKAIEVLKTLIEEGKQIGLKAMTFYCFSTENWKRSKTEVSHLMWLLEKYLKEYVDDLKQNRIQLRHIGRKDRLPKALIALLRDAENETAEDSEMILQLAIDYGGRDEIVRSFQKMAAEIPAEEWTEEQLDSFLDTAGVPVVDMMVRTSGEIRLSNYLIWQCAYSEFFFEEFYFPEFSPDRLHSLIESFRSRKRRFGS